MAMPRLCKPTTPMDTYGHLFDLRDDDKEAMKRTESRVMRGVNELLKNAA